MNSFSTNSDTIVRRPFFLCNIGVRRRALIKNKIHIKRAVKSSSLNFKLTNRQKVSVFDNIIIAHVCLIACRVLLRTGKHVQLHVYTIIYVLYYVWTGRNRSS